MEDERTRGAVDERTGREERRRETPDRGDQPFAGACATVGVNLVHVKVPPERRNAVEETLSSKEVEFVALAGDDSDRYSVIAFVVPTDAVEHVLADIRDAGLDENAFTVVSETAYAVGTGIEPLLEKYEQTPNRLGWRAIRSKVRDMRYNTWTYLTQMFLSAIIATAGLLAGSPAIIVGAMVIAPLVSPALASSLGVATRDRRLFFDGVKAQALGLAVAVVGAIGFAFLVKTFYFVPQTLGILNLEYVSLRLAPGILAIAVGLAAGSAAAYGLATKQTVSITGVMIAAALVPAAGATGIAVAWSRPSLAFGSTTLLLVNLICINLAGAATLWYLGYRRGSTGPEWGFTNLDGRQLASAVATVVVVIAIVAGIGVLTYQQVHYQREVNQAVSSVLERPAYDELAVVGLQTQFVSSFTGGGEITVTISRTSNQPYADLPARLERRISEQVGRDVTVKVRFVDYRVSNANARLERPRAAPVGAGATTALAPASPQI